MTDAVEIIHHANEQHRALIVPDYYPSEPYDDGGSPILRIERNGWYGGSAEQVKHITSHEVDPSIIEAAAKWAAEPDVFERYLRIFHGVTAVKWYEPHDDTYVTFDTAAWREEVGAPEGSIDMTEWRAYCEGNVYGIVIEQLVTWVRADDIGGEKQEWETVDSCFGYYGYTDYLMETASEMLDDATEPVAA